MAKDSVRKRAVFITPSGRIISKSEAERAGRQGRPIKKVTIKATKAAAKPGKQSGRKFKAKPLSDAEAMRILKGGGQSMSKALRRHK